MTISEPFASISTSTSTCTSDLDPSSSSSNFTLTPELDPSILTPTTTSASTPVSTSTSNLDPRSIPTVDPPSCVICLGPIAEPCEALPCGHRDYDFLCLCTWLLERATCPLCNAPTKEVRYADGGTAGWRTYRLPPAPAPARPRREEGRDAAAGSPRGPLSARPRRHRRSPPDSPPVRHRRRVYSHGLYSLRVGSSARSGYREIGPEDFVRDEQLVRRARAWIRRELRVFDFLHHHDYAPDDASEGPGGPRARRVGRAEFILELVLAILRTVDTQGSQGQAEEMVQEHLGRDNARLFLHELRSFLRSPYRTPQEWDSKVQYGDGERAVTCRRLWGDGYRPVPSPPDRLQIGARR